MAYTFSWHQDINPFNILVKVRGPGKYEYDFKLADLGLSHFERHLSYLRDVFTQDNFGTSAYGIQFSQASTNTLTLRI